MFHAQVSGKIISVQANPSDTNVQHAIVVEFVEKIFVDGQLRDRNWRVYAPKHKENWLKRQNERGFTVVLVLSQIYGMASLNMMVDGQVHASAQMEELLTL